jgi:hypothetical protein
MKLSGRYIRWFLFMYIWNILIAFSQLGNALLFGDPDETISGRVGKHLPDSIIAKKINRLFFWQKNHVKEAVENDRGNRDLIF